MSGMGYLLLLAALKEQERKKQANASFRRVEKEEKSDSYHYTPRVPTEKEKIFQYVETNDELKAFFTKLKEFRLDYNKKFRHGLNKEISDFSHEYYQELTELENMKVELYDSDLTVGDEYTEDIGYVPVLLTTEGRGFGGYGKYSYNVAYSVGITFNGAAVTPDMLDKGVNPYREEYDKWLVENPTIEDDIAKLTQAINALEMKYKKSLFKTKDKLAEIDGLKEKLNALVEVKKLGDSLKSKVIAVDSLTNEQKEAIRRYFAKIDKCKEYGLQLKERINHACSNDYEISQDMFDFLIDFGIRSGHFTQEEIDRVIELMSPEIIETLTEGLPYFPYRTEFDVMGFYQDIVLGTLDKKDSKKL